MFFYFQTNPHLVIVSGHTTCWPPRVAPCLTGQWTRVRVFQTWPGHWGNVNNNTIQCQDRRLCPDITVLIDQDLTRWIIDQGLALWTQGRIWLQMYFVFCFISFHCLEVILGPWAVLFMEIRHQYSILQNPTILQLTLPIQTTIKPVGEYNTLGIYKRNIVKIVNFFEHLQFLENKCCAKFYYGGREVSLDISLCYKNSVEFSPLTKTRTKTTCGGSELLAIIILCFLVVNCWINDSYKPLSLKGDSR